jgi:hypothetical protein
MSNATIKGAENKDSGCEYCTKSEEAFIVPDYDTSMRIPVEVFLCSWADESPESATKLLDVPVWLSREALGGHLMRPGDCAKCAAYKKRQT